MPETPEAIRGLADTMITRFTPPSFVPGCEVKSITDIDEYTTNNGWIEAIVGGDNQQRVRYYGTPQGVAVNDFVDVEYFPAYKLYRVFGSTLGGTAATGGVRVNKVWDSVFGSVALETDASDNVTINTGTLTLPSDIIHLGDTDNKISFADDVQTFTVGGLVALQMTNTTQDLVEIGDVAGTGDWDIKLNNGQMLLEGSSGNVGIGNTPITSFDVVRAGTNAQALGTFITYNDQLIFPSDFNFVKSHTDTKGSLVDTIDTEILGRLFFLGVAGGGAQFGAAAIIQVVQNGAVGAAIVPADMEFQVATATASPATALKIESGGNIIIGNTISPLAKTHIDQTSTTAAIPTLYLDQADISEEMVEFNTTIGVGNAIEAVGAKTLTTTHFIKVTLPGALTRYIPVGTIA